jgi:hypothetical protein
MQASHAAGDAAVTAVSATAPLTAIEMDRAKAKRRRKAASHVEGRLALEGRLRDAWKLRRTRPEAIEIQGRKFGRDNPET